ncbi:hypothetical protein FACS1894198_2540 [Clostridia bacterium]|nr:hypothetical protein FACS1894198_2540 [Clostridia bacterium]
MFEKLSEKNKLKDWHGFEMVAFDINSPDKSAPHEFLLGIATRETSLRTIASNVCHNEIRQNAAEGYGKWTVLPVVRNYQRVPRAKIIFCKSSDPIKTDAGDETANGLLGTKRDIFLRLLAQEKNPANVCSMVGTSEETYMWTKIRPGLLARLRRTPITDWEKLISSREKYFAEYFALSFADQKDPAKTEPILRRFMDRALLELEIAFTDSALGAAAMQNKATIVAWQKGEKTPETLELLRQQLFEQTCETLPEQERADWGVSWGLLLRSIDDSEGRRYWEPDYYDRCYPEREVRKTRNLQETSDRLGWPLIALLGHRDRIAKYKALPNWRFTFFLKTTEDQAVSCVHFGAWEGKKVSSPFAETLANPILCQQGLSPDYWFLRWFEKGVWALLFHPRCADWPPKQIEPVHAYSYAEKCEIKQEKDHPGECLLE